MQSCRPITKSPRARQSAQSVILGVTVSTSQNHPLCRHITLELLQGQVPQLLLQTAPRASMARLAMEQTHPPLMATGHCILTVFNVLDRSLRLVTHLTWRLAWVCQLPVEGRLGQTPNPSSLQKLTGPLPQYLTLAMCQMINRLRRNQCLKVNAQTRPSSATNGKGRRHLRFHLIKYHLIRSKNLLSQQDHPFPVSKPAQILLL